MPGDLRHVPRRVLQLRTMPPGTLSLVHHVSNLSACCEHSAMTGPLSTLSRSQVVQIHCTGPSKCTSSSL